MKFFYIIGSVGITVFVLMMFFSEKRPLENSLSEADLSDLYKDSISNTIEKVDYKRGEHIILDDNREYFFIGKHVQGIPNYKGVLMDWISVGDSVYKEANQNWFLIKSKNYPDKIKVIFYR